MRRALALAAALAVIAPAAGAEESGEAALSAIEAKAAETARAEAKARNAAGLDRLEAGDFAAAEAAFREALTLAETGGDAARAAMATANIGEAKRRAGDLKAAEALLREHHRGGQSFIVVPRISDMEAVSDWLHENVPEVKFVPAHGQMSAGEIEERMSAFYEGKYDVLLATTIVESGLDLPSANTIIIHRADIFGLAQLYQLRGRVGRSKLRAYAYLTYEKDTQLSEVAEKRLKVLGDLDSLGAGFQLASHDLDIRGAGNLLGDEQSGHIREVGFELYQSMLEDAILAAKAGEMGLEAKPETVSPQITVDAPIMIPEDYVPDLAVRMALYRRLNDAENAAEIEALAAEMIDRFGPLPSATENLVRLIRIKLQAIEANIAKIDVGAAGTLVTFHQDNFPDGPGLIAYVDRLQGTAKLRPDMKLVISRAWNSPESRLNGLFQLTKGLSGIARKARKREKA